jgi:hypothetical protein
MQLMKFKAAGGGAILEEEGLEDTEASGIEEIIKLNRIRN